MKCLTYVLYFSFLVIATSCSKEESNNDQIINSGLVGTWNATNTSGGFGGFNCIYQPGEIVWVFDAEDNLNITLNVINTTAICGGQELGVTASDHTYGVLDSNDKKYLLIDGIELGEIVVSTSGFTIDQNNSSEGPGADGFFVTFAKQ